MSHTPTPWKHNIDAGCIEADGKMIADVGFMGVRPIENGNFICKAANNHDALVEVLKDLVNWIEPRLAKEGGIVDCRKNNPCIQCKAKSVLAQIEQEAE